MVFVIRAGHVAFNEISELFVIELELLLNASQCAYGHIAPVLFWVRDTGDLPSSDFDPAIQFLSGSSIARNFGIEG